MSQWQPLYLRADHEAAMMDALDAAGLVDDEQVIGGDPFKIRVHVFGTLWEPTTDSEAEPVALDGYHANVSVHPDHADHYATALAPVLLDPPPETPHVKYAGCA